MNFRGGKSVSRGHKVGEGQSWSCASVELLVNVKARHESYDHTNSYNILIRRVKKEWIRAGGGWRGQAGWADQERGVGGEHLRCRNQWVSAGQPVRGHPRVPRREKTVTWLAGWYRWEKRGMCRDAEIVRVWCYAGSVSWRVGCWDSRTFFRYVS